jgi:hypothetical protein
MTMKIFRAVSACALLAAAGCATQPPSAEQLSGLPVVQFGEAVPAGVDYILFFPPDMPIPVNVAVKGSIFAREAEQRLDVTLRRGIYTYRNWVSYDRVTWRNGPEVIKSDFRIMIPSYRHPEPGVIRIQMDERG